MVDLCEVWEDERQFVTCLGSEELMGGIPLHRSDPYIVKRRYNVFASIARQPVVPVNNINRQRSCKPC